MTELESEVRQFDLKVCALNFYPSLGKEGPCGNVHNVCKWHIKREFSSVAQSCPTLCDPRDCSTPGLPVNHQLPELTQTHVHWVGDTIQWSHTLSSPSPPAFNLSQHQGLFKWVSSLHQVAKVLEFQLQHQSFQWTLRTDFLLGWIGLNSLQSKGLSRVFSNTTVQKHQFFGAQISLQSNSHIHTWLLFWLDGLVI